MKPRPPKKRTSQYIILSLLIALIVGFVILFSFLAYIKYVSFSFHDMDLATINQTFYNTLHGRFISHAYGKATIMGGHKWIIIIPLIPIYALFPSPLTLLFLQALAFGLAAWPIYLLSKNLLNPGFGLLFAFCYLIYPAMNYAELYEFHPICFATPLLLFLFYYLYKKKWGLFLLFTLLSLSVREDVTIPVFGIGLFSLLQGCRQSGQRPWPRFKWALVLLCLSVFFVILDLKLLPTLASRFNPETASSSMVESFYGWLTGPPTELPGKIFAHPQLGILRTPKLRYLLHLFIPLGFLSLLSPASLIMVLVSLAEGLLSSRFTHFSIRYQYSAIIIPFVFISAIYGTKNILQWKWFKGKQKYLAICILIFSVGSAVILGPLFRLPEGMREWKITEEDQARQSLVNMIPPSSPMVATFGFIPKLSMRPQIFWFYHIYASPRIPGFGLHIPEIQKSGEYALIDFNDWLTFYDFYTPNGDRAINKFFREGRWGVEESVNNLVLFKKDYSGRFSLIEKVRNPLIQSPLNLEVIPGVKLLGFDLHQTDLERMLLLDFSCYMELSQRFPGGLLLNPTFVSRNDPGVSFQQPMFAPYRILPSNRWEPREIYKQRCRILVPSGLPPGGYDLRLGLLFQKGRGFEGKIIYQQQNVFNLNGSNL